MTSESPRPRVSVCIPTYNGARFIQAALDSASGQTFGDLEILCVDDGSSDETVAIIEAHRERDPRTVLIRNERNLGLVGNWNRCLELAGGEWIKFLFQDDTLSPRCVELMLNATKEGDRFVVCDREYAFEMPEEIDDFYRTVPRLTEMTPKSRLTADEAAELFARKLNLNIAGEPICVLFRADVPKEFGPFDARLRQLCDHEYSVRVAGNLGLAVVHEGLAQFNVHGSSTSAKNSRATVNVSTVDFAILLDKVERDPLFARVRAAMGGRLGSERLWNLYLLAKGGALEEDRTFAAFLAESPGSARRYRRIAVKPVTKALTAWYRLVGKIAR